MQRIIEPDAGSLYRSIGPMDANAALQSLFGGAYGGLFMVDAGEAGAIVEAQFRYAHALAAAETLLSPVGMRLGVIHDGTKRCVVAKAERVQDHSALIELSQDYGIHMQTSQGRLERYNRVIVLGEELMADVYRLASGGIVAGRPPDWDSTAERAIVLEQTGTQPLEEMIETASTALQGYGELETVEMNTADTEIDLNLGDWVSARDRVTGLEARVGVTRMILTINGRGSRIETKMG